MARAVPFSDPTSEARPSRALASAGGRATNDPRSPAPAAPVAGSRPGPPLAVWAWSVLTGAVLVAILLPLSTADTGAVSVVARHGMIVGLVVAGSVRIARCDRGTERLGWAALVVPLAAVPLIAPFEDRSIVDGSGTWSMVFSAPLAQLGSMAAVFLLVPENRGAVRARRPFDLWWPLPLLLGVIWTASIAPVFDLAVSGSVTTAALIASPVLLAVQETLYLAPPDRRSATVAGARMLIVASMMIGGSQVAFVMDAAGDGMAPAGGVADGFRIVALGLVGAAIASVRTPEPGEDAHRTTSSRHRVVLPIAVGAAVVLRIAIGVEAGDVVFLLGMILAMVHLGRTIGERDSLVDELSDRAGTDALTQLANRSTLRAHLDTIVDRGVPASLVYLDLDGFKLTNDELGHAAGDRLLVTTAERMTASLPREAMVARVGGDEFVAVLPGVGPETNALAEAMIRALAAPLDVEGTIVEPRISAGLSPVVDDTDRALDQADMALYRAKRDPSTRLRIFDEAIRVEEHRRARIESALPAILDRGLLHVHYQPIVDLTNGRWLGVEALVRWPDQSEYNALEIVETAERLRLTDRLTEEVMARVALDLPELQALTSLPLWCTVNVSVMGEGRSIPRMLESAFGRRGAPPPTDIVLEITERQLPDDIDALSRRLTSLREQGYRIAIDDFGAGYSALSHLGRLPFDMLKLDGAFTRGLPVGMDLIDLVVRLSHRRRAVVVAESVEQPRQARALAEIGCDLGQGYLWQRPLPVETLRRDADLRSRAGGARRAATVVPS